MSELVLVFRILRSDHQVLTSSREILDGQRQTDRQTVSSHNQQEGQRLQILALIQVVADTHKIIEYTEYSSIRALSQDVSVKHQLRTGRLRPSRP